MQEKAFLLAQKWILNNFRVFQKSGVMWEKYDGKYFNSRCFKIFIIRKLVRHLVNKFKTYEHKSLIFQLLEMCQKPDRVVNTVSR